MSANRHPVKPAAKLAAQPAITAAPVKVDDNISLLFFSEQEGSNLASLDLTREQFQALQRRAELGNYPLKQLLKIGFAQMANPLPTPQQRSDLMTLEHSIEAAGTLAVMLAEQTEDRGALNLTGNVVLKLNSDFATFKAAFNAEVAS